MYHPAPEMTTIPQKVIDWLFHENELSLSIIEWIKLLSATILISNQSLLQEVFTILAKKLENAHDDITIYSTLSYLAFSNPKEGLF